MPKSNKHGLPWTITVHHNNLNAKPRQRLGPDKQLYAEKYRARCIVFLEVALPPLLSDLQTTRKCGPTTSRGFTTLAENTNYSAFHWVQCLGCVVTVLSKKRCSIGSGKKGVN